jgi:hypothetical protein
MRPLAALHLIGGTLLLTEAVGANTYSGGTVVETGSTLDLTTGNLYYDAQGDKSGSTVQLVAHFTNDLHLTATSLYFIS